ncbi:type II toxin-antitoxin system RelE/ParE family toxin [bacterium]|nr:type II toxin-antitoxin system RelE/ParE family toxin [bacterium]
MPTYKLSRKAFLDLVEIGRYTESKWGIKQRNIPLKQIDDCFTKLAENPNLGVKCDYIKKGYRKFPQGSHIVYYRSNSDDSIDIIRILHNSMDFESHF